MAGNIHISVVTPVYGCDNALYELYEGITASLTRITNDFEIVMVNDASPDNSWETIKHLAAKDKRVKGINLSRNFGQHYAITAGLKYTKGDWVVVMDCDFQDRPEEIPNLYRKTLEGWDIVLANRVKRQDRLLKQLSSKLFHWMYGSLSGLDVNSGTANFGIYHSKVITEYNKMHDVARSFFSSIKYLGFKACTIDVVHSARFKGASSYTLSKLFSLAGDIIISNSNKPLKIGITLGFFISILSFLIAFYNILAHYRGIIQVPGFTTTVFSIWFMGGIILTFMGILGLYIGKIFNQVKGRPLFVVSEVVNIETKNQ